MGEFNRLRVIRALHRHPAISRTELAGRSGLSRPTVTALIEELESAGIVQLQHALDDERPRHTGRPPVLISLAPRAAFAVGVDVGHDHVGAAVCDLSGEVLADAWAAHEVDHAPAETLALVRELVERTLGEAGARVEDVVGVGLGVAAPVNRVTGEVYTEGILSDWGGVQPALELRERLGLPVMLENDANLGALGEHVFGAGRGAQDIVYVRLAAGIGIGLILRGQPYGGTIGLAGELGHVPVVSDGAICRCGNRGCLETVASSTAVARLLASSRGEPVSVQRLLALVAAGDRGARRAVADAGEAVGAAISSVVNVLNPERVVVGGELAEAGAAVLEPMRLAIDRHAVKPAADVLELRAGELGARAEVLGAAALILAESPRVLAERLTRHAAAPTPLA